MPGLVEGHAHMMAGAMWDFAYAGFHDRMDPQGQMVEGQDRIWRRWCATCRTMKRRWHRVQPLLGWGLDPIFFAGERLSRKHLDQISTDRPVAIMFSNFHLMCVNSKALEMAGYDRATNAEGVVKDAKGDPTGELQEMAAMFPVMRRVGMDFRGLSQTEGAIRSYGEVCMRAGVTTVTDLYSQMEDADLATLVAVTDDAGFPAQGWCRCWAWPEPIPRRPRPARWRSRRNRATSCGWGRSS